MTKKEDVPAIYQDVEKKRIRITRKHTMCTHVRKVSLQVKYGSYTVTKLLACICVSGILWLVATFLNSRVYGKILVLKKGDVSTLTTFAIQHDSCARCASFFSHRIKTYGSKFLKR